ncbi:MAG: YqgE/AlgH family protein [Gammaproteobacteria bacterium]|nr:YqgE/AlgH family protein [Gammaproteobacteria bacterium]MDH5803262.1 YqgE/AlgH family protein [Gammaproteobacteria bacterium]
MSRLRVSALPLCLLLSLTAAVANPVTNSQAGTNNLSRGAFLVSTKKLDNSSFQKTVILVTHYSRRGATGIAVNRESEWRIKDVFPHTKTMQHIEDKLFLGGPVQPESIFVLVSSKAGMDTMQKILPDLYFSAGSRAVAHGFANQNADRIRAFAGYSGWAPGQLENEISRGDWLVIQADHQVIFQNHKDLWKKLFTSWSGRWI